jgi:hypothetical protein
MSTELPYPNGYITRREFDKLEGRVTKVEDEADDIRVLSFRIAELEGTVKWLVRSIVGLAGVIAAAAGIIARGG